MPRLTDIPQALRKLFGPSRAKPVSLVAERFLHLFSEHGVEPAQIPRLLPELKLGDLQSVERLLGVLTPELLDKAARLFGIRVQWLEGQDDRIYDYLATCKEPRILLDHLRRLGQQPFWANEAGCPLRILATTERLDYRDSRRHELAPILVEPIALLGEEPIYRYHVYQDGFSWDHQSARIELKAIALATYQALHRPIPIYPVSQQDMDAVLEGQRIPRSLLGTCLSTDPSLEDYILDTAASAVAKEADELPAVRRYLADTGLDTYDFAAQPAGDCAAPDTKPAPIQESNQGKRQTARETWQRIETAALTLWARDAGLPIAQVVRQLQMIPEIKAHALQPDTIRKRIARLAPAGIRGKPGRKPNQSG